MYSPKRILVFPFGLMAHYLRSIAYCKKYHPNDLCLFASHPEYDDFMAKHGYDTFTYRHSAVKQIIEEAKQFRFDWVNKEVLNASYQQQVRAIKSFQPDIVLGDSKITLKMACQKTGVHYISLMNAYMSPEYSGTRRLPRMHPKYHFRSKTPEFIFDILTRWIEKKVHRKLYLAFEEIRREQNLPTCQGFLYEYEGDETKIVDDKEVFSISKERAGYETKGVLYYSDIEPIEKLQVWRGDKPKKLVISLGSSGDWDRVIPMLEKGLTDWEVLVLGGPEDIRTHSFMPLNQALTGADLLICHGGNGTAYEGRRAGVKMLFVCNHFEQEWNAERFSALGYGRIIEKNELLSEELLWESL